MPESQARSRGLPALLALGAISLAGSHYVNAGAAHDAAAARHAATAQSSVVSPATPPAGTILNTLNVYCVTCHNSRLKTAGLLLDALDVTRVADDAQQWEKVAMKLRTGEMPPPGRPRPDSTTSRAVAAALERELDAAAAAHPHPGRVPVHRLSRSEYANAVRDLLDVEVDARALLPSDEADQEGFDNVASVLSVSPALLEDYLSAARKHQPQGGRRSDAAARDRQLQDLEGARARRPASATTCPSALEAARSSATTFPSTPSIRSRVLLRRQEYDYIVGMGERHQLDFRLDGALLKRFSVGGEGKGMTTPENFAGNTQGDPEWEEYMHTADAHLEMRIAGEGGPSRGRRLFRRPIRGSPKAFCSRRKLASDGRPTSITTAIPQWRSCRSAALTGFRLLVARPAAGSCLSAIRRTAASEEPCARRILSTLATRAYRRPVTERDMHALLGFYQAGRAEAGFEAGIQRGLERILAAPSFLFRVEREPAGVAPGAPYRLSELDLASRLSFFLWGSIPDDELRDAAARQTLSVPGAIEQQVQRMLRDPRSNALVDNFASRWLELSKLSGVVPDTELYSEFDENLRDAMEQETRLFIGSQVRGDRSVMDLVTADYSYPQ